MEKTIDLVNKKNLFIVGAPKAGTTYLFNLLSDHPDISPSKVKEPHYFDEIIPSGRTTVIKSKKDYQSLFSCSANEKIQMEATASYLYFSSSAGKIFDYNPLSKIVIMLRHPVDRAYSHYLMDRETYGIVSCDFETALEGTGRGYHGKNVNPYISPSLYCESVAHFLNIFGSRNVCIVLFEDFVSNVVVELSRIVRFLGLDVHCLETAKENNSFKVSRFRWALNFLYSEKSKKIRNKIPLRFKHYIKDRILYKSSVYEKLSEGKRSIYFDRYFREDIKNLSGFIDVDLFDRWNIQ